MGSAVTSVGSRGGKTLFTFTATGQDTGSLHPKMWEASRWMKWLFQLTGTGTGYSVTMYGTIDTPTAYNQPGNAGAWFPLPSPSVESGFSWSNPITASPPNNALYANYPLVAVRAVSGLAVGFSAVTGEVKLQMFAIP